MTPEEMLSAMEDADRLARRTDDMTLRMLKLAKTRLRSITNYWDTAILCDIKRELQNFNMQTRCWK